MVTKNGDFHHPYLLETPDFEEKLEQIVSAVKEGLPPKDAIAMVYGCQTLVYYEWVKKSQDDKAHGFTARDSKLIKLMDEIAKADAKSHLFMAKRARQMATNEENPSSDMMKFLLERRYGYKKQTKQDVEVSTKDDMNFNINIVDSKKKEE